MQAKLEQSEAKEQIALGKLQERTHMLEQSQFERNEVSPQWFSIPLLDGSSLFFQATVERDQIQIELTETQKRMKKLIDEMNEKIAQERQNADRLCEERLKDNAEKVNRHGR